MNTYGAGAALSGITAAHLAIIVIFAILALLVIWWGTRRRGARRAARSEAIHRREDASDAAPPSPAQPERVQPAAAQPPPTMPSPPPLADSPVVARSPLPTRPAAEGGGAAPVTLLKGLGPRVAARLGELGVTQVDQIAALTPADAEALDRDLGAFSGRMERDRWIEQAQLLAAGDRAGFEARFGKIG